MLLGGINLGGKLNGYTLSNHTAHQLPQTLATAVNNLFDGEGKMLGATYKPLWYLGSQIVNGKNHALICEQTRMTGNSSKRIVVVVINISAGDIDGSKASIVEVIDDAELVEGTDLDLHLKDHFKSALSSMLGVKYTPVMYIGSQVVKGMNHYIVSEARIVRPDSEPYAVMICINVFEDTAIVVGIERME